ncbi:MAG: hypothetical protein Q9162_001735 [Coniocarpon cinnabarinum]
MASWPLRPIVHGMRAFRADINEAPAKRLVLFVGDGLRADKAFQSFPDPSPDPSAAGSSAALEPRPLAPFLRSRVLSHGTFGVSHTRVPTESRPGHVALIAGLYEDVSAVATGWKLNPVNFDSVFNRSRHTWSWGSPDILPMFKEGAVPGRIDTDTYPPEVEDFTSDATHLDTWVFDRVRRMFKEDAMHDKKLDAALRQDQNVFFLHLLGLDTTGHGYRPYSKEYLNNIKIVDTGVQEITELIESFYGDGQTAFVFTADHGMSDWGSHGDGHPDNTRTPLIAWGSGVAKPRPVKKGQIASGHDDEFSSDWGLQHVPRFDVAQADIAALMAHLVGLEYPTNSVGELPLPYLDADTKEKAQAMLANAQEIVEQYRVKEQEKQATEIRYQPFPAFTGDQGADAKLDQVKQSIARGEYELAIEQAIALNKVGLEGMRYLQTYDWLFLRILVTLGYLGWIAFSLTTAIDLHMLHGKAETQRDHRTIAAFATAGVALCALLFARSSSWRYYLYAIFPLLFWEDVFARRTSIAKGLRAFVSQAGSQSSQASLIFNSIAAIGILEALVQSYFHREVYTICYLLAPLWPFVYGMAFIRQNVLIVTTWTLACVSMSLFTLLPAIKVESVNMILFGGGSMFIVGLVYLSFEKSLLASTKAWTGLAAQTADNTSRIIIGIQVGLVALSMLVTRSSVVSLQARLGLPLGTQVVGWITLIASLTVPFLHMLQPNSNYVHRLVVLFLSFAPVFVILTIQYEGLFYLAFCATLVSWVRLEYRVYSYGAISAAPRQQKVASIDNKPTANGTAHTLNNPSTSTNRTLSPTSLRTTAFFLYLLQSAFFSTGNIASISSFSLDAVYRLLPIFDPFSQGALLLLKLMIPFFFLSACLALLNTALGFGKGALAMLVSGVGEWLVIRFFWSVRDEGSWLEIGETITRFVIVSMLGVFVAGMEGLGAVVVGSVDGFEAHENNTAEGAGNGGGRKRRASVAEKLIQAEEREVQLEKREIEKDVKSANGSVET